mmetsp:Transcript_13202/g.19731  ORF Transcript_13202/g.19731 Transcript_13202/m.19731 type:complete len:100 (+) Transcript_13202:3-302(+)
MTRRSFRAAHRLFSTVPKNTLEFKIERTLSNNLPIYSEYRKGRTQFHTILRKYKGDEQVLKSHVQHIVGNNEIKVKGSQMVIRGDHRKELTKYFSELGF